MSRSSISLKENSANFWLATAAGTAGSQKLPHHKGQTQRKLCCFMAMFTHQQLSLTLRVQFQQPKPWWKLTATERNSSATASPPLKNQPLPLRCHSSPAPPAPRASSACWAGRARTGVTPFLPNWVSVSPPSSAGLGWTVYGCSVTQPDSLRNYSNFSFPNSLLQ